jgi:hypothetical protein
MKKALVLFFAFFAFNSVSYALLIEPYVGAESGTTKYSDGTLAGSQYGLRLAYEAPVFFWGGLDLTSANVTSKPTAGGEVEYKKSTVYGVLGVNFPILIRAWLAYGFYNELKANEADLTYKGSATKVGLGFKVFPMVSLNLEYLTEKYSELNGSAISSSQPQNDGYIVSLSIPW